MRSIRDSTFRKDRDFRASVRRIQKHNILVVGSFIIGLDIDKPGIGKRVAETAIQYGVDNLQVLFLTPLPGTRLMKQMISDGHVILDTFPDDWKYYTLTYPVARYKHLSMNEIIEEMISGDRRFYSIRAILGRIRSSLWRWRAPLLTMFGNLAFRRNLWLSCKEYAAFQAILRRN